MPLNVTQPANLYDQMLRNAELARDGKVHQTTPIPEVPETTQPGNTQPSTGAVIPPQAPSPGVTTEELDRLSNRNADGTKPAGEGSVFDALVRNRIDDEVATTEDTVLTREQVRDFPTLLGYVRQLQPDQYLTLAEPPSAKTIGKLSLNYKLGSCHEFNLCPKGDKYLLVLGTAMRTERAGMPPVARCNVVGREWSLHYHPDGAAPSKADIQAAAKLGMTVLPILSPAEDVKTRMEGNVMDTDFVVAYYAINPPGGSRLISSEPATDAPWHFDKR